MNTYDIENGFIGMNKYVCAKLIEADAKRQISKVIIDEQVEKYLDASVNKCGDYNEIKETITKYIVPDVRNYLFNELKYKPLYDLTHKYSYFLNDCHRNLKSILGISDETFKLKNHWCYKELMTNCNNFVYGEPFDFTKQILEKF